MGALWLESSITYLSFPSGLTTGSQGAVGDRKSLPFFEWKVRGNISDRSYNKLRALMLQQHNIEIDDVRTTRRQLASELRIFMRGFHCCINSCMTFIGTHELSRICSHCKTPRFYGDSGDGEEGDMIMAPVLFLLLTGSSAQTPSILAVESEGCLGLFTMANWLLKDCFEY